MVDKQIIEIQTSTVVRIILTVLSFWAIYILRDVLLIVFLAVIISSAVNPFAKWTSRFKIPRLLSVIFFYLLFFGILVIFLALVVPVLITELSHLSKILPDLLSGLSTVIEQSAGSVGSDSFDLIGELQSLLSSFSNFLEISSSSYPTLIVSVFGNVFTFVAVLVISFYLALMPGGVSQFLKSVTPEKYESSVVNFWKRSESQIGRWFQGQFVLALSVGLMVYIALSLLDVKYALILALLATVLEVVPVAGPVIAGIPAVFFAYIQSPVLALWVLIVYMGVQQIEAHFLAPVILGKSVGLNPVMVIIALLIGAQVAGILGILIAVPAAVIVVEIFESLAAERQSRKEVKG